jgi:tetratricopeptide (TPR) repeat protein
MQAERDALRDFVLPRVNEFSAKYGRAVEIIDLRWGVDTASVSEAEQNQKVLRTCLDEIKRSRPFFLGLIGDRYGWAPPRPYMESALEAAHFSIEDTNMSVTALEIEYGVLRSKNPPVCLFYFRESPDYAVMPEKLRLIYQDGTEGCSKLAKLKEEIRARFAHDIKSYAAEVHETGLVVSKDWADIVAADIIVKLREEWGEPSDTPPDWKEQEREMQEVFCESRTAHFAGRTAAISDMTAFCLGGKTAPQILMIQGEAGSGKSGLLCKVTDEIEGKCLLLPFSCGISSRSSLVENMLRYFIFLICEKLALEDDSDAITKFQDIKDRFIELLFTASKKTRVVAVVDALDQLAGSDEARRMLWISGRLPENFRLLCSIIDGPETEVIKQFGGEVRPVTPVNKEDEAAIIHGIASRQHKQISGAVVEHILQKQTPDGVYAAQNPLYLSLITQDLVMMDRYELETVQKYMEDGASQPEALAKFMRERINETPGDPESAYLAILGRMEKLIGKDFVRGVCGMIAVSRSGLRESDIEGAFREMGMDFNPADFSWLRQMMRGHVSQGDMQQWDFSHQSLRRALRKKTPEELERLNNGIVAHFRNIVAQDDFAAREIMHHLCAANRPDIAAEVIAAYEDKHNAAFERGLADVYTEHKEGPAFLLKIPESSKNVEETERWLITENIRGILSLLPEKTRPFRIELMFAAISILEGQEDLRTQIVKADSKNKVAGLYSEMGESEKAGEYYRKSLDARVKIYEQSDDVFMLSELSDSYESMGDYLTELGQTEEAGEYYRKSLDARVKIYEQEGDISALRKLSESCYNMGNYLMALGQTQEAGEYFRKFLDMRVQIYEQEGVSALGGLSASYDAMGDYLTALGQTEEAGEYYRKFLDAIVQIYEQEGDILSLSDLSVSYVKMGDHLTALGQTEEAGEYYRKSLDAGARIYEQTDTVWALSDLSASYVKMGDHLTALGETEEAGEYYRKSLDARARIYEQAGGVKALWDLSASYNRMGDHLTALGETEEAGEYYRKCLDAMAQIYEQAGGVKALRDLSASYSKMGDHLTALGETEEAGEYYRKSLDAMEQIYEQAGNVSALSDLSLSYVKMGDHLTALGETEEAGEYYRKSLDARARIYEQAGNVKALWDLSASCERMGNHLTVLGQMQEAGEYYRKSLDAMAQIYEQAGNVKALRDLSMMYIRMGDHLTALGQMQEAGEYYRKSLDAMTQIYEQAGNIYALSDLSMSYDRMGGHLTKLGKIEEAGEYYRKGLDADVQIYEQAGGVSALRGLSVSYERMGGHLTKLGKIEEAGEYYHKCLDARLQIYEQAGNVSALSDLSVSYDKMGGHLTKLGKIEEAGEYYCKCLDADTQIYEQTGTATALYHLVISYDRLGDNKYALEFYDEARICRLNALELFEQYVILDPSAQKRDSYFRDKAMQS